jgi:hypothetical protein
MAEILVNGQIGKVLSSTVKLKNRFIPILQNDLVPLGFLGVQPLLDGGVNRDKP